MAIPWLHVVREHPVFLADYVDLFEPAKGIKAMGCRWLRVLRNKAGRFRQLGGAWRLDGKPWFGPRYLPERVDVLLVSHLLNASHAGQPNDFYFGELPDALAARGHSVAIALINHSGQPGAALAGQWQESAVPRVILSDSLGLLEEAALHRRLKKESFRLRKLAKQQTAGLFRKVLVMASQEALSGGSRTTLRMAKQIGALVAKLKPKAVVVTHEGHAWERVAFAAARSALSEVRCIGYQHAALFRLQHAIRRNLAREYNPDHILTAGTVSKAQLERAPGLDGIPISVLGSNRSFKGTPVNGGCTTGHERAAHADNSACLVLPEGIASECHLLFEFSLACARVFPEVPFIWRLHPIVTHESLVAQNPKLRNLPGNILFSRATLEEDITRSRYALYRGTTAIVQAAVAGLRPIYLMLPGELTIDPLYELKDWRVKISTVSDFQHVILSDASMSQDSLTSEKRYIKNYCNNFFLPLDNDRFMSVIF